MTIPLDPAGLEAAAKAVYEAIPVALKDLVARERAEAATGIEHGSGVPDTWIARRAVRAYLAASPDERLREWPDEGWSPGIDDPEPPALGDIDTGEGWYQT